MLGKHRRADKAQRCLDQRRALAAVCMVVDTAVLGNSADGETAGAHFCNSRRDQLLDRVRAGAALLDLKRNGSQGSQSPRARWHPPGDDVVQWTT